MDLAAKLEYEMYAWLVGKQMFCPVTGKVLDVRTAVIVEAADGVKTHAVLSPEGWARAKADMLELVPDARVVINGIVQPKETAL